MKHDIPSRFDPIEKRLDEIERYLCTHDKAAMGVPMVTLYENLTMLRKHLGLEWVYKHGKPAVDAVPAKWVLELPTKKHWWQSRA